MVVDCGAPLNTVIFTADPAVISKTLLSMGACWGELARRRFVPVSPMRRSLECGKAAMLHFAARYLPRWHTGSLQNNGGTENACRAHEKSAPAGDDTIRGTQVGRTLSTTIEDQQLIPNQHRFGNNGTDSARPCQSGHGDDQMNE